MANENLKLKKPHMTYVDGYFYMFDEDTDMLLAKADDGITSFSYPFDTLLTDTVVSCEHDGINFWTMSPGAAANTLSIRRWRIENYLCKLQNTITLSNPYHKFISQSFTIEHYHCSISGSYSPGAYEITIKNPPLGDLTSGMTVTLGPNIAGQHETIYVQDYNNGVITLVDPITFTYEDNDTLLFYNYIWLFNNANELDTTTGALYRLSAYSGSVITKSPGGAYKDITASTFYRIDHFTEFGPVDSLMYVKASNLLFINVHDSSLVYYGSMAMDTIHSDEITIIPVYDMAVHDKNVYRLQKLATYYGATVSWTTYNYQAATFNSMVSSIALNTSPNIIAANSVSTSEITARVKDQFGQPVAGRLVYFTDDDTDGTIVAGKTVVNTDSKGEAHSTYKAGISAKLVRITAKVDQT